MVQAQALPTPVDVFPLSEELSMGDCRVLDPFNALHYTCFIVPKDAIAAQNAAPRVRMRLPSIADVLLRLAAKAVSIAWAPVGGKTPEVPLLPYSVIAVDWRLSRHRGNADNTSAWLVRLRWFGPATDGPRLHLVRQAILDAIVAGVREELLSMDALTDGVVQLDDDC